MASEDFIRAVKHIVQLARAGKTEEAYASYRGLFSHPSFNKHPAEDRRRVLNLMIRAKKMGNIPPDYVVEAHRAAIGPLTELAATYGEPADFEMLGLCQVMIDDEKAASASFKAGLNIERERNPQSNLCGALMKWVASV